jgi:hypothetical protein
MADHTGTFMDNWGHKWFGEISNGRNLKMLESLIFLYFI